MPFRENNTIKIIRYRKTAESKTTAKDGLLGQLRQFVASKLLNLATLSAIFTVAGFFIVHSYMATFTHMFTYNISVSQYLAAGISLVIGTIWYIVARIIQELNDQGIFLLGGVIVAVFIFFLVERRIGKEAFLDAGEKLVRWYRRISISYLLLFAALTGFVYGYSFYNQVPRMLGGGEPANVILVFKETQMPTPSWPITINSLNRSQSESVQLLIELTDGILVRDPRVGVPVIVNNDVLQGMFDASPPTPHNVSAPILIPSLTLTTSVTPTVSSTPTATTTATP